MTIQLSYTLRIITIVLLIGCLAKLPYGYFQFVRLSTTIMFLALAYAEFERKKLLTAIMCVGFAILLNPIIKVHFIRSTWNAIDVVIACCLTAWMIFDLLISAKSGKP